MDKSKKKNAIFGILALSIICMWPLGAAAQDKAVTINFSDTRLEAVLDALEAQSGYLFTYGDNIDVARTVSVSAAGKSLKQVLDEVLAPAGIGYSVSGTSIVLTPAAAQTTDGPRALTGQIVDPKGGPIAGAMVSVKGTAALAITAGDGRFQLDIPAGTAGPVLAVSFLGYQSTEQPVGSQSEVTVTLREDATEIDQVVVTALGIKRSEKALSYNVQSVASDQITTVKDANFMNALSGKVAGLNINASSGGTGSAAKVQMRGSRSIMQSSNALYVIDGVPMLNPSSEKGNITGFESEGATDLLSNLNPEDIESMSVLMGAAAAALYGSVAANGAVIINTKRGEEGKTSLTVSQNTDFVRAFRTPDFQTRYGTSETNFSWGARLNQFNYQGYEPARDYFRTGVTTTESVSLSTGNNRNQTYVSAAAVNSQGIIPNSKYDRYNFSFRNTAKFLEDRMKLDLGATYARQSDLNMTSRGVYSNPVVSAYLYPRGNDWSAVQNFEHWDPSRGISLPNWDMGPGEYVLQNPYWINYRNLRENRREHYTFNVNLTYDVFDWLKLSGRVNLDSSHARGTTKFYAGTNKQLTGNSENGFYGESTDVMRQTYADFLAHINKNFGNDWSFNATVGTSIHDIYNDGRDFRGPIRDEKITSESMMPSNVFNFNSVSTIAMSRQLYGYREQMQSVFGSAEVGFRGTYFLTATLRTDWPSQLAGPASTRKSFTYPSVGGSIVVNQMLDLPRWINYMKVRGSYANVGLAFQRGLAYPTLPYTGGPGGGWDTKSSMPVKDLKPEFTHSWEAGLTARFLRHINFDFTFYNTNTVGQLLRPEVSASSGYSAIYVQNGNVLNRGVEIALGFKDEWGDFGWDTNFTLSSNHNRIVKLAGEVYDPTTGQSSSFSQLPMGGLGSAKFLLKEGGSLGDLYSLADLRRDSNGNVYIDPDGKVFYNRLSSTDQSSWIKMGSIFPKANLGWRNDFTWKNLNAGILFTARLGGVVYSRTQATLDFYGVSEASAAARDNGGVMVNGGDVVDPFKWYRTVASGDGIPQLYTYDATNVRLAEASIGYRIPRKWLGNVADVTVSVVGRNLWMIYCRAPYDPESASSVGNDYYQGIDYFMSPSTRNMGFSVRINF